MSASTKRWPGETDETFPDVFNIKAMLPQPSVKKPGQLPETLIRQFFEEGYVVVDKFFETQELDPCREAIKLQVDELANALYKAGKIKELYQDKDLFERLTFIEKDFPGANIVLHKRGGRLAQAFRDVWSNPRLLNVVEQLIGPDIMGHPVWNLRTKTPQNEATTVPWHQDSGYLDNRSYEVLQVTAWIPLLDATRENGCMEVAARGHLKGKVATHTCCWRNTHYIMLDEQEMARTLDVDLEKDIKLCPVPYGGMLLLNNMIPHRSLNNLSDKIRWSLDLRWQRPDKDVGFYDLKQGVLMRTSSRPQLSIDWEAFDSVDRTKAQTENTTGDEEEDEFDTTIPGPWMLKWEMVNPNQHTAQLKKEKITWQKN